MPVLPPPPPYFIGRNSERDEIIDVLLQENPGRVAILGFGGMGKTTLALSVLHSDLITTSFPRRLFVSCEGITTLDALLSEIGNTLRLPRDQSDLYGTILQSLQTRGTVICLDNFETVWEPQDGRTRIQDFLAHLSSIPSLGLLVTMRGSEKPAATKIRWTPFHSLMTLGPEDSRLLFETISGTWDEYCEKLVTGVEGIPLAITLLSHLVADESESTEAVWRRWQRRRTAAIQHGDGQDRLTSLSISIQLSLSSSRVQSVPSAIELLKLIALLPDGLRYTDDSFAWLAQHIPSIEFDDAAKTLVRTSTCSENGTYGRNTIPPSTSPNT